MISPTNWYNAGAGGMAYIGSFSWGSDTPAWVFTQQPSNGTKYIAEAASHETGHNLGLAHDGKGTASYYTGTSGWAAIMGVGYYQPLVHWSKGEYTGATSTQDDMSIIQGYVPGRVDDVSDSTTAAVALPLPADTVGLVSTRVDVDTHRIVLPAGDVSLDARPSAVSPNLDLKLQELASDGSVFARSNPPGWMLLP